jgi:hypothetical protein
VLDIQNQLAAVESDIRDKAGERAAAEAEIRLAKDTGKPEPAGAVQKLKELGHDNTTLVNKKTQLTVAWREAMKDLEECEKNCRTGVATPGKPAHKAASSRRTTEQRRPRLPDQPRRENTALPPVTVEIGIDRGRYHERDHRRGHEHDRRGGGGGIGIGIGVGGGFQ